MALIPSDAFDIGIIGGGIIGLATALALTRKSPGIRLVVIEKEPALAFHQTGHNSGVIHSGLYYKPGSLKARNCVAGRDRMYAFCSEQGIAFERCGKLVVATHADEIPALRELERRGALNGLKGLRRLAPEAAREIEPHVACVEALFVPDTGIVDFKAVSEAYARLLREADVDIRLSTALTGVRDDGNAIVLLTSSGDIRARGLINCAGLQSDRIARLCGADLGLRILPFRGEYYELTQGAQKLVRNLIYPVPDPRFPFLGVHFTRMIGGGIEAGPNAVLSLNREGYRRGSFNVADASNALGFSGFWRMSARYWRMGLGEMYRSWSRSAYVRALQLLIPELTDADVTPSGCGIRAQAVLPDGTLVDDFRIVREPRMIHVLNAPSPAATASLTIGEAIAEMAEGLAVLEN